MRTAAPSTTCVMASEHPNVDLEELPPVDRPAAEALAATMAAWDAAELDAYRRAVIDELSTKGSAGVRGFLAVELAALSALTDLGA